MGILDTFHREDIIAFIIPLAGLIKKQLKGLKDLISEKTEYKDMKGDFEFWRLQSGNEVCTLYETKISPIEGLNRPTYYDFIKTACEDLRSDKQFTDNFQKLAAALLESKEYIKSKIQDQMSIFANNN
jgi:hypothetical protein